MALGGPGTINGREINALPIDGAGGPIAKDLAADIGINFSQTAELVRVRALVPYGITTFQSVLAQIVRTRALEPYGIFTLDSALEALTKVQLLETDETVEFRQIVVVDLSPAMNAEQTIEFVFEAEIDNAFFGHWFDGLRMSVPAENRGLRVPGDGNGRLIIVEPDPDELVPSKDREVVA